MTSRNTVKLTAVLATIILTIGALAMYTTGFGTGNGNGDKENVRNEEPADPVDSATLAEGLAELQKITERYQNGNLLVQGEIRYFAGDSASLPSEKAPFTFGVEGENSLYELDSVLTITGPDLALIIDKREKSIAVAEKDKIEGNEPAMQPMPGAVDGFKEFIRQIKISREGQFKQLVITFTDDVPANMLEYTIVYDDKTYAIKKLRMKMTDSELLNGLPSEENNSTVTEDDELFMVDSANNALPTGMYASVQVAVYEIVYNLERTVQKGTIHPTGYVHVRNGEYIPSDKYKSFSILQ